MRYSLNQILFGGMIVTMTGCCTAADCESIAWLNLKNLSADELEKGAWETTYNGRTHTSLLMGQKWLQLVVRESPVRLLLPTDTITIELRFQRGICNKCFPGFKKDYFPQLAGFVWKGREIRGDTLIVTR